MKETKNSERENKESELNDLGRKYAESISEKTPGDFIKTYDKQSKTNHYIDRRTKSQRELADKIIENSQNLIQGVIRNMVQGNGHKMPSGGIIKLSLKGNSGIEDFFAEGVATVLERLHNYNPSNGGMNPFIGCNVAQGVYRYYLTGEGLFYLPERISIKAKKIVSKSAGRREAIKEIQEKITYKGKKIDYTNAATIYAGCFNYHEILDEQDDDENQVRIKRSQLKADSEYEGIKKIEDEIFRKESKRIIKKMMRSLEKRERRIINMRFGIDYNREYTLKELGEEYGVTKERIRQIETRALEKLKEKAKGMEL